MPEEFKVVCQILKSLSRIYNITFHSQEIDFIASYFSILNQWSTHISPGILLICHGNSTAADMVSCAREKMKGDYALDFINFSPDMTLEDCLSLACVKAKELNHGAGVLFLCDLEPLTTIGGIYSERNRYSDPCPLTGHTAASFEMRRDGDIKHIDIAGTADGIRHKRVPLQRTVK